MVELLSNLRELKSILMEEAELWDASRNSKTAGHISEFEVMVCTLTELAQEGDYRTLIVMVRHSNLDASRLQKCFWKTKEAQAKKMRAYILWTRMMDLAVKAALNQQLPGVGK